MRRIAPSGSHIRSRLRILVFFAIILGGFAIAHQFDTTIQPLLQEFAEYETQAATVRLMNAAIADQLEEKPETLQDLYTIEYSADGSLKSVESNSYAVNLARGALVDAVEEKLNRAPEQQIDIPLGSLLDSAILNNLGPRWKLIIQPEGYVDGVLIESVEPMEINRVVYQVELQLTTAVNMILDGRAHVLWVKTAIPLVHILLEGNIPDYYAQHS